MAEQDGGPTQEDTGVETRADIDELLTECGFDAETSTLTRRQAEVLAMRERGLKQETIADLLGTSRANVASVESRARENVAKSRATVSFADALSAPVRVEITPGTDLYEIPDEVFEVCDDAGMKLHHTAPDLMKIISDAAIDAVQGREVRQRLVVTVTDDGTVQVQTT
jgi:Tfx family DNA-binding protein